MVSGGTDVEHFSSFRRCLRRIFFLLTSYLTKRGTGFYSYNHYGAYGVKFTAF